MKTVMKHWSAGNAFVCREDALLSFGNRFYTRTIDLSGGFPRTVSLKSGGMEWAAEDKKGCDCSFFGINMPGRGKTEYRLKGNVEAVYRENPQFDAPHLELTIRFEEKVQQAEFTRTFCIYPELPACSVRNSLISQVIPGCYWSHRRKLSAPSSRFPVPFQESCADSLRLAAGVLPVRSVEFRGRTDYHNEPVEEHPLRHMDRRCSGNLIYFSAPSGETLLCLQEAPPSAERRDFETYDFRLEDGEFYSCCWGIAPEDLVPGRAVTGYRHTILFCPSGVEPERILHRYLASRFPMRSEEAAVLVNPWGCGSFPELVSANFLREEICAAEEIGAEVYQIDDSWQNGNGLSELTDNNRAVGCDFWTVSPKHFPDGFEELRNWSGSVKPGLWCAPSFTGAYRDWEAFADMLIDYHRRYGFVTVKVDGVRMQSAIAEERLESLLRKVRSETGGGVYFNLDTTNGQRPGYFLFLEYGNIFLENRYVTTEGVIGYHPEKTLRNLWLLSRYVRTQSLQIEIPAPDDIPEGMVFRHDPREYDFEYWCAVALFANMLIWTAPSRLSKESKAVLRKMTALQKTIRPELFSGMVRPVLNCPDGRSLTGFASDAGYRLIFREAGCAEDSAEMPSAAGRILAGRGVLRGRSLTLPAGGYCLWKA